MNTAELLDQFVIEARECLETIGQRLIDAERAPDDSELLNDLFRQVHTLKGNCGLFDFKPLERVVHAGEDLLDRVRDGQLGYSNEIADALLAALDFTANCIDDIEAGGKVDPAGEGDSHRIASALRALLPGAAGAPAAAASLARTDGPAAPSGPRDAALSTDTGASTDPTPQAEPARAAPDWLATLDATLLARWPDAIVLRYRAEPECFFKGEDPWKLALSTPGLVHIEVRNNEDWPADPAGFDCYRAVLDYLVIADAPRAYLEEHFRYVPEQVELHELAAPVAARPALPAAGAPRAAGITRPTDAGTPTVAAPPADDRADVIDALLRRRARQLWDDQIVLLQRPGLAAGALHAVRNTLLRLAGAGAEAPPPAQEGIAVLLAWARLHGAQGEGECRAAEADEPLAAATPAPGAGMPDTQRRPHDDSANPARILKVGQEKIDRLMDLIGEMVVAKNSLPYLAQRAEVAYGQRELAREIKAQYAVINRIAEDMQHAIMQVRMLPVGSIFQRFGRLVRDIGRKLGKEVQLVIEGEETEADKNVIESLADPLVHVMRNSLDHGIELPAARLAAGKPAQGTIRISARQESDRVVIEVADDGAGVDPDRVRAKAVERGLIPEDKAATLSDADAVQLLFLPGFSTADTVSDLSGRGVGMDAVRSAIERINGQLDFTSAKGKGSTLRLSLPLSMAVTNVMIIEAAGRRFGVPMDMIVETVRVHADDIHHFKAASTTVLRGRIVPLRPLNSLLAVDEPALINTDGEHAVLVVRVFGGQVGLLVDQFHGTTDIILKPLEGVLAGLTGFAGTALMGDGSVLMVLNPKELV